MFGYSELWGSTFLLQKRCHPVDNLEGVVKGNPSLTLVAIEAFEIIQSTEAQRTEGPAVKPESSDKQSGDL